MSGRGVLFRTALAVGLLLALAIGMLTLALPYGLSYLDIGQRPQKSDAIFVLLGDYDVRPFVGAALYNVGFAPEVILSRHSQPLAEGNEQWFSGHQVAQQILLSRGVPPDAIRLIGTGSQNTMNEIEALKEYLQQHPRTVVTVVTTHYHTRRTRWSLQQLGPAASQIRYVSAPHDDFDATNWWRSMRGFEVVTMEYVKLAIYWYFYGSGVLVTVLALIGIGALLLIRWWLGANRQSK